MMTKGFSLAAAVLIAGQGLIPSIASAQNAPKAKSEAKAPAKEAVEEEAEVSFNPIGSATAKDENVNVRGQASFTGEVVAKLKKGQEVTIIEEITRKKPAKDEPTNWFRIKLPAGTPVWVFADFVNAETKTVKSKRLNFRGGPGENYSVLGRLNKGDVVKSISTKGAWMEIETPEHAYAFVAADFFEKSAPAPVAVPAPTPTPAPAPAPTPEIVAAPEPVVPAQPVVTEPAPQPAVDQPVQPAPVAVEAPVAAPVLVSPPPAPAAETLVKRVVRREGTVRVAQNIQAPSYFELEGWDSRKVVNYLHSPEDKVIDEKSKKTRLVPKIDLGLYVGQRVVVTGEEILDRRWKSTPVIEVEAVELEQ